MTQAADIVAFWRQAGRDRWFTKDEAFDQEFRTRFLSVHEAAARGDLDTWADTPEGSLALLILLDQFPRNSFRGSPRMYATDPLALKVAETAVAAGHDSAMPEELQVFFYLPFEHSENLGDQDRSVALHEHLGGEHAKYAEHHRDIIRRFGRFPHRNPILGRAMTPEEQAFLDEGGFGG